MVEYTREEFEIFEKVSAGHFQEDLVMFLETIKDDIDMEYVPMIENIIESIKMIDDVKMLLKFKGHFDNCYWDGDRFEYLLKEILEDGTFGYFLPIRPLEEEE